MDRVFQRRFQVGLPVMGVMQVLVEQADLKVLQVGQDIMDTFLALKMFLM